MNPYLAAKRAEYDGLRTSIEGLQTRAAEEKRDLTEEELRSVTEQAEQAKKLATQIEGLTEIETRNAKVAALAASLNEVKPDTEGAPAPTGDGQQQERSAAGQGVEKLTGTTTTRDRDPGHYTRSGQNSFFGDIYRARNGDEDAVRRLAEHNRALSTGAGGGGVVPPRWLPEEFDLLARQGRALANVVRQIPLGDDPRPITLPKQTAGTDTEVTEQANENDPVEDDDTWNSGVDTVIPKPTSGIQIVSRQMLDMSNPAVDQLIYGDLLSAYNLKVEKKVGAALVASAGAAVTTFATNAAFADAEDGSDAIVDTAIAVRNARKLPANILAVTVNRYGAMLKWKDSTGRPLIPLDSGGPMNVIGVGSVDVDGRVHGLGVVATDGIGDGTTYPESAVVARSADTILFESNMLRFRYEEPLGPESVKLGIWAYTGVIVRQAGKSAKRIIVTAAS